MIKTRAIKFNKLTNHTFFSKHLNYSENKIGCSNAFSHLPFKLKTNHFWNKHRYRLTKHRGFRFNTANTPTQNSKAIDHSRMTIGSNQRIRKSLGHTIQLFGPYGLRKIFKIYLMANASAWWHNAEIIKRP